MYLQELLDSKLPIEEVENTSKSVILKTMVGKEEVLYMAERISGRWWTLSFEVNGYHFKTGAGNEFKKFSGLGALFDTLVKEKHPDIVSFVIHKTEIERAAIYKKFAKRYAPGAEIVEKDAGRYMIYYVKIRPSKAMDLTIASDAITNKLLNKVVDNLQSTAQKITRR